MRIIKFRGQNIKGEWHYGFLSYNKDVSSDYEWFISNKAGKPFAFGVIERSIGQFTGLYDKNGKEIYEGDINQYGYVIKYCEEKALFAEYGTRNGIDYDILMSFPIDSKSQIIKGNIYQNPELLTD